MLQPPLEKGEGQYDAPGEGPKVEGMDIFINRQDERKELSLSSDCNCGSDERAGYLLLALKRNEVGL